MSEYRIVADTSGDLPEELLEKMDIDTIPFPFSIGENSYKHYADQREMNISDFYQQVRSGAMPITSQVNPTDYETYFTEFLKKGGDLLYLCFSSGLSGSCMSATLAAQSVMEKYPDRRVEVVDTKCASLGEAAFVYEAWKQKQKGMDLDQLKAWAEKECLHVHHWFMVENLFHLKRGGRVSGVEALVGTALKIKPILSLDQEGKLVVRSKARGLKNALDYLISRVEEETEKPKETVYMIGHADCRDRAEKLKERLSQDGYGKEFFIGEIGPVIGSHVGPGMCAVAFYAPENA